MNTVHPVIFSDVYVIARAGQLALRQRMLGLEVEQLLPVAAATFEFSCRLSYQDARRLSVVDFSQAPFVGLDDGDNVTFWVEYPTRAAGVNRTNFTAHIARPARPYVVRLRSHLSRESVFEVVLRATVSTPFVEKEWGVTVSPENALLMAHLIKSFSPNEFWIGDCDRGVVLIAGAFSVVFLNDVKDDEKE